MVEKEQIPDHHILSGLYVATDEQTYTVNYRFDVNKGPVTTKLKTITLDPSSTVSVIDLPHLIKIPQNLHKHAASF